MPDEIELAAIAARSKELLERMTTGGLIQQVICTNGHTAWTPTEYGWFAFSTLYDWFEPIMVDAIEENRQPYKWPIEIKFQTQCADCPEGMPGFRLANG